VSALRLPFKKETKLVQAFIGLDLYQAIKEACLKHNISVKAAIEFGLETFLEKLKESEREKL
jgi:uncharacterized membrane protein (DUF373 family)